MSTKKSNKIYAAAAALAVTASAVAPGLTADAATKVTVKSIVNPKSISHYGGYSFAVKKLSLPKTVKVLLSNKKYANHSVKWSKVSYDPAKLGKYQTITGTVSGTSKKAYIKVKINSYAIDVLEPKLAPVAVGEKLMLPSSVGVKYKSGNIVKRSTKSMNLSSADTSKAGKMKLSYDYKGNNSSIKGNFYYEVKAAEITNVMGTVKEDMLSVSADVKYPAKDAKVELLVYPNKDVSKVMTIPAELKDGKLMAKTGVIALEGTHSFAIKVGDVVSPAKDFVIKAPMLKEVKAINSTQAVVTFDSKIGEVMASNFTIDKNFTVIKAEVNPDNKMEVKLTFNKALVDNDTYKVSVNGIKSASGIEMKEVANSEFKYEIAAVKTVQLTSAKFYDEDNVLDSVVVKDSNGLVLDNDALTFEISSTDSSAVDSDGDVSTTTFKSFYVEVKVKDGADVLATTGAVKVSVAPDLEVSAFDGLHIGDLTASSEVSEYESAKKSSELDTDLKVREDGATLNLFGKDVQGNTVLLSPVAASGSTPANYTITNLTPTVANVSVTNGKFVIKTVSVGKAQAKIKVGDIETTVMFDVVANEKIADATLSKTKVALDTSVNDLSDDVDVDVSLLDQYGDDFTIPANTTTTTDDTSTVVNFDNGSKLTVKSGNTRIATATIADTGVVTISKPTTNGLKGSTVVTVEFKDASGKVVFTKSINVTATDFDSEVAKYDLVMASSNSLLNADDDTNQTGSDRDDAVTFALKQLDKYGNVIGTEDLDGTDAELTFTTSTASDLSFFSASYSSGAGEIDLDADAVYKLVNAGILKVTAKVGGVAVDTLDVSYKNTDAVATKAMVNTSNRTVDLSNLVSNGTSVSINELLFGKLNVAGTKYVLNPTLTIQDQFAKTMSYDIATATDTLANGLTVNPSTPVVTNLNNVTNSNGSLSLTDTSKAGTVTIVIPAVSTSKNADLLASPVSINVTLVK